MATTESTRTWRFVESYPRLAGLCPAVGYALVVALLWVVVPTAAFGLALLGELLAFGLLVLFRDAREPDPTRSLGELPTYADDGFADAWVVTFDPDPSDRRRVALIRATRTFLVALFACCLAVTFGAASVATEGPLL
jgi:hypothetical protein